MTRLLFDLLIKKNKKKNSFIVVELKNGISVVGEMIKLDYIMNIFIKNSIFINESGDHFKKSKFTVLKSNSIKYIRFV